MNNPDKITTAIILAGGMGVRLRGAVSGLPKPMAPINNRPFLEYQMDYWIEQGINRFILSVGYLKNLIIEHFSDTYKSATIEYATEDSPLGTGGGMLLSAKNLNDTFLVLNGDTFIDVDLDSLYKIHMDRKSKWTLSLFRSDNLNRYLGVNIDSDSRVISLRGKKQQPGFLANGGVYLINPEALEFLNYDIGVKISLEDELLPNFIHNGGELYGMECKGRFIDIGIPKDYFRSSKIILG